MDIKRLGAINDLTVAAEFLMCAVRGIAEGREADDDSVQTYLSLAADKMAYLDKRFRYGGQARGGDIP